MWLSLLVNGSILAAIFLYNRFLGPKPEIPSNAPKDAPQFPRATEGDPIPLIFGLVKVTGPNVVWTSGNRLSPIDDLVEGHTVIIGYSYEMGLSMVCGIPMESEIQPATARRLWIDDRLAWPHHPYAGSLRESPLTNPITLRLGTDIGEFQNVAQGLVWWMPGTRSQNYTDDLKDLYDLAHDRRNLSGFRRQCMLTFTALDAAHQGFLWGLSPSLPSVAVEIKSAGETNDLGSFIGQIGDGDANPVIVLYRLLTQKWGGIGRYTEAQIDLPSFLAAAITLVEEQHGFSAMIYNEQQGRQTISEILGQIDGILYDDHAQGKVVLKLVRDDYDIGDSEVLDDTNVLEISSYTTTTWAELYNRVVVTYTDRDHDYKERSVTVSNEAGIEAADGVVRSTTYSFPSVCDAFIAARLATRQLQALSVPLCRVRLIVDQDCWNTKPGDVVAWSSTEYGITDMVLRVVEVNTGILTDNRIVLDCFQDRFAVDYTLNDLPTVTILPLLDPSPIADRYVTEAPRYMLRQLQLLGGGVDPDIQRGYYLATQVDDFSTYVSRIVRDDSPIRVTDTMSLSFPITTTVAVDFPRTTDAYSTGTALVLVYTADLADALASATVVQIQQEGRNLILVNDEFMAFESYSGDEISGYILLANVWRGLLDTPAQDHVMGATMRLLSPPWLGAVGSATMTVNMEVDAKIIPRAGLLVLADDAQESDTFIVRMRTLLPYPPANIEMAGGEDLALTKIPVPLEEDGLYVSWTPRERTTDTIVRGDAADESVVDTTYDLVARHVVDDEWTDIDIINGNDDFSDLPLGIVGHGSLEVGVRGRRSNPAGGEDLASWDVAALEITAYHWRNLILNPRADSSLDLLMM